MTAGLSGIDMLEAELLTAARVTKEQRVLGSDSSAYSTVSGRRALTVARDDSVRPHTCRFVRSRDSEEGGRTDSSVDSQQRAE